MGKFATSGWIYSIGAGHWSPPDALTPGDSRLNLGDYAAFNSNQSRDGTQKRS
jgi:hypothetical protein